MISGLDFSPLILLLAVYFLRGRGRAHDPFHGAEGEGSSMSGARIIDGKALAAKLRERRGGRRSRRWRERSGPGLAVVLVGEDPASAVYVRNKNRETQAAGMASFEHNLPADTPEPELLALVASLNRDPAVHGILVQLPLPDGIDSAKVLRAIDPAKDVDGFHPENVGALWTGAPALAPLHAARLHDHAGRQSTPTGWSASVRWSSGAPTSSASRWQPCCSPSTAR